MKIAASHQRPKIRFEINSANIIKLIFRWAFEVLFFMKYECEKYSVNVSFEIYIKFIVELFFCPKFFELYTNLSRFHYTTPTQYKIIKKSAHLINSITLF